MKIVICSSLDFTYEIKEVADKLEKRGHEVIMPKTSKTILEGRIALEKIMKEKENGEIYKRARRLNVVKEYFEKIKKADAVLILNLDKKRIKNYIGASVFLEMGFAHVLDKKIFLFSDIPNMFHKDEIKIMQPIVINGDLDKIKL